MRVSHVTGAARRAGICPGDTLLRVNGHAVEDILDVRYHTYEPKLQLELRAPDGVARLVALTHLPGSDIGLTFESDIPGGGRTCRNNCVFCFIDQNPPGCRDSLYVKDDDARLSFLQGNYITMTNLSERDIARICAMRLGPLGISVHTTDPVLRVKMLQNKHAGDSLGALRRFAEAGVPMNMQIVLCPGYNDGAALEQTLSNLQGLGDAVISTSIVPAGLTKYRAGLPALNPVTGKDALAAIQTASRYPRVFCSDEMYLRAGLLIPPADFYQDFPQLENGVGMLALFRDDWETLVPTKSRVVRPCTIATGYAAAPLLAELLRPFPAVSVIPIENRFFGDTVNVAGLLTGSDLLRGLGGRDLGARVLIPSSMLRRGEDVFLDDMTVSELSQRLGVPVVAVEANAEGLWNALLTPTDLPNRQ